MPARTKFTEQDYRRLASLLGLQWLDSEVPTTSKVKTRWQCADRHTFESTYDKTATKLKKGRNACPICSRQHANDPKKRAPEDYDALAKSKGLTWLGPVAPNARTLTKWRCKNGHEFLSGFATVAKHGRCLVCYRAKMEENHRWLSINDYQQLAEENGFRLIGDIPKSTDQKATWQCPEGHQWEQHYHKIRNGRGCPLCIRADRKGYRRINGMFVSEPQLKLKEMIGGQLNFRVGRYGIDIAFPEHKIAIEYDSWYWHRKTEQHDALRTEYLLSNGWRIIRVKSGRLLPSEEQVREALARLESGEVCVGIVLEDWGG